VSFGEVFALPVVALSVVALLVVAPLRESLPRTDAGMEIAHRGTTQADAAPFS